MKRKLRPMTLSLLTIASLTMLVSCQKSDAPFISKNGTLFLSTDSVINTSTSNFTIAVSSDEISVLIDTDASFVLYFGNAYCSSCIAFNPSFSTYINETNMLIYSYDNIENGNDFDILLQRYPEVFSLNMVTPSLYFFKLGELRTKQIGNSRMLDINTFRPMMKSFAQAVNINVIHDAETYQTKLTDGIVLAYDRTNTSIVSLYNDFLFPYFSTMEGSIYQLELTLNENLSNYISQEFASSTVPLLYELEDGAVTSFINLADQTSATIISWLDNQLGA